MINDIAPSGVCSIHICIIYIQGGRTGKSVDDRDLNRRLLYKRQCVEGCKVEVGS